METGALPGDKRRLTNFELTVRLGYKELCWEKDVKTSVSVGEKDTDVALSSSRKIPIKKLI